VDLTIDFPNEDGLLPYRMLMSLQGIGPTSVNGLLVPLTMDGFLHDSLRGITPSQGVGFQGTLSSNGRALAQLVVTPGGLPASAIGRTAFFAVVNSLLDVSSVAQAIHFTQ